MPKKRQRDEKFRMVMVRVPRERGPELDEAAKERGQKPAQFVLTTLMDALNARKRILPVESQSTIANS